MGKEENNANRARTKHRTAGRRNVSVWLPEEFVAAVDRLCVEKEWPRSLLIENVLRKELGLPEIEPRFGTNLSLLERLAAEKIKLKRAERKPPEQ